MNSYVVYADGGCRRNGGATAEAYGSYAKETRGGRREFVRLTFPHARTNNQAEYQTLLSVLEALQALLAQNKRAKVSIYMDSNLVVNQLSGAWRTKDPILRDLRNRAAQYLQELAESGVEASVTYLPRAEIEAVLGH